MQFAGLESNLGDEDRARAIYELGIEQPTIDMPELVWKAFIEFEEDNREYDRVRTLYERLLEKTDHYKIWVAYYKFELSISEDNDHGEEEVSGPSNDAVIRARAILSRAHKHFKEMDKTQEVCLFKSKALTIPNRSNIFNTAHKHPAFVAPL